MRVSATVQNAAADAGVDLVDSGAGTAVLEIYSGSAPGSIGGSPAGTLLLSFDLPNPAFSAAGTPDGQADLLGVPISEVGVGAGDAGYARIRNRNGDTLFDTESVGTSGTEVIMSTVTVSVGLDVDLTAATLTVPAGSV